MIEGMRLHDPDDCGADGYPAVWHSLIKHLVRKQAGHRCVRCGHPYPVGIAKNHPRGEWTPCDELCTHEGPTKSWDVWDEGNPVRGIPAQIEEEVTLARWRILTVHHLDGNKWNLLWWNLAALCQRCHLQIQGKVRMEQTYALEHSEWFKPYAAGYYAWSYLGLELTREETMVRLDELLGLERVG